MTEFPLLMRDAILEGRCLRLVLSRRGPGAAGDAERVSMRPVTLRGESHFQFAFRVGTQERHENLPPAEAVARIDGLFGGEFLEANLFTSEFDATARIGRDGRASVRRSPPSLSPALAIAEHDRTKQRLIPEGRPCPFLVETGVMTAAGKVKADRQHKFRQINRFLEFVEDVVPHLSAEGPLDVVDFGCGKSYLTFAVHHLLAEIHGREVRITGLDRNESVIATCRGIAERLGLRGLEFRVGDIASHVPEGKVDLAISLHACDTATDAALAQAVQWKADAILAAPCCQHELSPQLDAAGLEPMLKHGILRERFAALATDALRAELLERRGYRTQVLEFIEMEHTPKNLLIRAVRRQERRGDEPLPDDAFERMKERLGVRQFALEIALDEESCRPTK